MHASVYAAGLHKRTTGADRKAQVLADITADRNWKIGVYATVHRGRFHPRREILRNSQPNAAVRGGQTNPARRGAGGEVHIQGTVRRGAVHIAADTIETNGTVQGFESNLPVDRLYRDAAVESLKV